MVERTRLSALEFLDLPETNTPTELIEGEIIVSPAPSLRHQGAARSTFRVLDRLIPDGELFFAPVDVYLAPDIVVQPDLVWLSAAKGGGKRIGDRYIEGAPALV